MLRKLRFAFCSAGALALGACSSSTTPSPDGGPNPTACTGIPSPCVAIAAGAAESDIDNQIAQAAAGTTFIFAAGTYTFSNTIAIPAVAGLSFIGAGMTETTFDFTAQTAGSGGISAVLGNSNIKFEKFNIKNTHGDGIKVLGATGVVFEEIGASWSDPDVTTHGAYGIYPVQSTNVLIDHCEASGARDTGLYIGQSYNIQVSNNLVHDNVAGIEIESSISADVYGNESRDNTGGVLVFSLPALLPPPDSGAATDGTVNVRVFNNNIHDNNTLNFGDPSGTVYGIPGGTGVVVLAAANVEVFGNTITNNTTDAYSVVSYFLLDGSYDPTDPANNGMNPFAMNVYEHDNVFTNNGQTPQSMNYDGSTNQLGGLLAILDLLGGFGPAGGVPNVLWDGIANESDPLNYVPPAIGSDSAGTPPNPYNIFAGTDGAGWANLNLPVTAAGGTIPTAETAQGVNFVAGPFSFDSNNPPAGWPFPLPAVDAGVSP